MHGGVTGEAGDRPPMSIRDEVGFLTTAGGGWVVAMSGSETTVEGGFDFGHFLFQFLYAVADVEALG
jgi:hypothetical protein